MIARLLHLDELLFRRIGSFRPSGLVRVMRGLTHLGNAESWFVIGFFLLACGGQAAHYGLLLGTGALLATLVSQTLKRACCRPRPSNKLPGFVAIIDNPDAFSFPSGHAAAAFAVAVALAGQGAGLGPLALVLATAISISRIYLGARTRAASGAAARKHAIEASSTARDSCAGRRTARPAADRSDRGRRPPRRRRGQRRGSACAAKYSACGIDTTDPSKPKESGC